MQRSENQMGGATQSGLTERQDDAPQDNAGPRARFRRARRRRAVRALGQQYIEGF
jgi:hypothetical protein